MTTKEMQKYQQELQKQQQPALAISNEMLRQGHSMQQIRTDHITSVGIVNPRKSPAEIERQVIAEATQWPDGLVYSFPVRNKDGSQGKIEGATIGLANMLARVYGNCTTYTNLISESPTHWVFEGVFLDRETATEVKRTFIKKKPLVARGKWDIERLEEANFQIGQSKALRKAIIDGMPKGLVEAVMECARRNLGRAYVRNASSHEEIISKIKQSFIKFCQLEDLERYLQKPSSEWGEDEIGACRALLAAFQDGRQTPEGFLKTISTAPTNEPAEKTAVVDAIIDEDGVVQDA